MKHVTIAALALLVAGSTAFAQKDFDKSRHPWARHKVGTSVTFKLTIDGGGQEMEGTYKQTLTELKDKSYALTTSIDLMDQPNDREDSEEMPSYVGEETLKVCDKEFKCTVWTSKGKQGLKETTTKYWLTDSVKTPLKIEVKDGDDASTLVAAELSEKIKVGEKEYECVRYEGEMHTEVGKAKAKIWMNPEVPGLAVKMDLSVDGDAGSMKIGLEITKIDIAK